MDLPCSEEDCNFSSSLEDKQVLWAKLQLVCVCVYVYLCSLSLWISWLMLLILVWSFFRLCSGGRWLQSAGLEPCKIHTSLYYIILYYTIQWLSCGLMHVHDFTDRQVWHWPVWVTAVQSEEAWRKQKTEFGFINIHVYKETYVFKCTCVTSFRQNKWISCRLLGHVVNFHLPIRKTEHIVRLKMKQDVSRIMTVLKSETLNSISGFLLPCAACLITSFTH